MVIGDSLAKPFPHPDNEVWCTLFYYLNHWRFASGEAEGQEDSGDKEGQGMAAVTLEHPPENVRLIEGADGQLMLCIEPTS